jgi:HlyD family secretion protein
MKTKKIVTAVIIGVVTIGTTFFTGCNKDSVNFNTSTVKQESIEVFITATGYVQPVNQVSVGTQVSGIVEKIYVDFNSRVTKGQLLAEIDKLTLTEKLLQAQATQSNAESDLTFAQQNYDRTKQLFETNAATKATLDDVTNRLNQTKNALKNATANVKQAQLNLSYADIYSPISGVILNRAVDQGQTVAATFATPTMFTIAQDLTKMQVEANVDEADIGSVRKGQQVTFTVDSYTDEVFTGTVEQIRLQPQVTSNVVTYVVIITAPNPDEKLFPGMTANVSILTKQAQGLTIPAEALHFIPNETIVKELKLDKTQLNNGHDRQVWVKRGETIVPQKIKTGINDGINYIVESGLTTGDEIVLSLRKSK